MDEGGDDDAEGGEWGEGGAEDGQACASGSCGFSRHAAPPSHFEAADHPFCCRTCRTSAGRHHGGHCEKKPAAGEEAEAEEAEAEAEEEGYGYSVLLCSRACHT